MKITETRLKQIIKEELDSVVSEGFLDKFLKRKEIGKQGDYEWDDFSPEQKDSLRRAMDFEDPIARKADSEYAKKQAREKIQTDLEDFKNQRDARWEKEKKELDKILPLEYDKIFDWDDFTFVNRRFLVTALKLAKGDPTALKKKPIEILKAFAGGVFTDNFGNIYEPNGTAASRKLWHTYYYSDNPKPRRPQNIWHVYYKPNKIPNDVEYGRQGLAYSYVMLAFGAKFERPRGTSKIPISDSSGTVMANFNANERFFGDIEGWILPEINIPHSNYRPKAKWQDYRWVVENIARRFESQYQDKAANQAKQGKEIFPNHFYR